MLRDVAITCLTISAVQVIVGVIPSATVQGASARSLQGLPEQTFRLGDQFTGRVTYYGKLVPSPYETNGDGWPIACGLSWKPPGWRTTCINQASWDKSAFCGSCIKACWKETKECWNDGPKTEACKAAEAAAPKCEEMIIDNWTDSGRPGQMLPGWLDIADDGDGDWEVEWEIITCPNPSGELKWRTRNGNNANWADVKVEGTPGPVQSLSCNGKSANSKTDDAFYRFDSPGDGDLLPLNCEATMPDGTVYTSPEF